MSDDRLQVLGLISTLKPEQQERVKKLADAFRTMLKDDEVAILAFTLVGMEKQEGE